MITKFFLIIALVAITMPLLTYSFGIALVLYCAFWLGYALWRFQRWMVETSSKYI